MKKIKLLIILFCFTQLILSCNSFCKINSKSEILTKHFDNCQIQDLEKLVVFYKKWICDDFNKDVFDNCFKNSFPDLIPPHETSDNKVSKRLNELDKLYEDISINTFDEIWEFIPHNFKGKSSKFLCFKQESAYSDFLADLSNENDSIEKYLTELIQSGGFPPGFYMEHLINDNVKDFDFNKIETQILISIHFISIKDNIIRY